MSQPPDDRTVKLDELFGEAPAPRQRRTAWQVWAWAALQGIAGSFIIYMLLYVSDESLPYPVVLAICLGAAAVRRAVLTVREQAGRRPADVVELLRVRGREDRDDWYEGGDGMAEAVRRWDRHLSWGAVGGERFSVTVGKELGELVDERLHQRYGFTRSTDPERARRLLGERVWAMLGPTTRAPTPRQVMDALTDLDRLPGPEELIHGEER